MVGFEQSVYLVSEGAGAVEVCASIQGSGDVLLTGDSSTAVLLTTQPATASRECGWLKLKQAVTTKQTYQHYESPRYVQCIHFHFLFLHFPCTYESFAKQR